MPILVFIWFRPAFSLTFCLFKTQKLATEEKALTFNRITEILAAAVHKSLKMIFRFSENE